VTCTTPQQKIGLAVRGALPVVVLLALLLTGCGPTGSGGSGVGANSTSTTTNTRPPDTTGATANKTTLAFTVTTTGSVPAQGTFKYALGGIATCSAWVATGQTFSLELPQEALGGVGFELVFGIAAGDYHGPGAYTIDHTAALQAFYLGSHEFGLHDATLQVKADGSGSIVFSGKQDLLGDIDCGTISWTCT